MLWACCQDDAKLWVRASDAAPSQPNAMDAVVADRLLPNLFLLGNPKSGSTFLFGCLRSSFAPNLVCGATALPAWRTCEHSYVLTALGSKKEFNFWGSTGRRWGLEWYAGPSLPLSAWEWLPASAGERPWRRGENHELEPSRRVTETCLLNTSAPGRAACARFPLECVHGTPVVRPGCGVMRPHPSRRACAAAGGARACAAPRVFMSHAFPRRAEVAARAYALDPSINTFMFAPMWKAAPQRLRPIRPPARPASARSSSGRPLASARLGQLADTLWLAGRTGLVFHIGPLPLRRASWRRRTARRGRARCGSSRCCATRSHAPPARRADARYTVALLTYYGSAYDGSTYDGSTH